MNILNLISHTKQGFCQNIGDSFTSLALKHYLKKKSDRWQIGRFNEKHFNLNRWDKVVLGGGGLFNPHLLEVLETNVSWRTSQTPLFIMGVGLPVPTEISKAAGRVTAISTPIRCSSAIRTTAATDGAMIRIRQAWMKALMTTTATSAFKPARPA